MKKSSGFNSNSNRRRASTKLSDSQKEKYKLAWIEVKEGRLNVYQAAKKYELSQPTLYNWCKRDDIIESTPKSGRPCYLGSLEHKIENWILEAAATGDFIIPLFRYLEYTKIRDYVGFPMTPAALIAEARKYNEENQIMNGWTPGTKWYYGFMNRHKSLSLRTPQYMPIKKFNVKEEQIREWFTKVCNYICYQSFETMTFIYL